MQTAKKNTIRFCGRGVTSRRQINVVIHRRPMGHGIVFEMPGTADGAPVRIPARAEFVVNTLRNVTLGIGATRLCIVEHVLCAASLWGLNDLHVEIDGPELPLADGSARVWIDLFKEAGWQREPVQAVRMLSEPIVCKKGDRVLMAVPDDEFSATYLMDWNHPAIGRCWKTWTPSEPVEDVTDARTFGSLHEHQLLGLVDDVVSLTADGFTQPLRSPDEPVRHKVLDLIGDLALVGVNPLSWQARFISIKGGHELDVQLARELQKQLS
jgi:UDP-3-O-[3-hydroxymyristoyl] N-acetylglucosamine deacetylase